VGTTTNWHQKLSPLPGQFTSIPVKEHGAVSTTTHVELLQLAMDELEPYSRAWLLVGKVKDELKR